MSYGDYRPTPAEIHRAELLVTDMLLANSAEDWDVYEPLLERALDEPELHMRSLVAAATNFARFWATGEGLDSATALQQLATLMEMRSVVDDDDDPPGD